MKHVIELKKTNRLKSKANMRFVKCRCMDLEIVFKIIMRKEHCQFVNGNAAAFVYSFAFVHSQIID